MIFNDFLKSLRQMKDPAFLWVLALGVGLTITLLLGITLAVQYVLPDTVSLPFWGEVMWLSPVLSGLIWVSALVGSVFLMVPVASMFTGLFLDQVVDAVEGHHYPNMSPSPRAPLLRVLRDSMTFLGLMIFVNAFALVVYLLASVFAPIVFWSVNGFLLGREYFQMVALRRMTMADAKALRRKHMGKIFIAGVLMTIPLSIPIINLLVPVLGVATFTHLYHRLVK